MIKSKSVWVKSPLSRDEREHENFVITIADIIKDITRSKFKLEVLCTGYNYNEDKGPMAITPIGNNLDKFEIVCSFVDCIPYEPIEIFRNRIGKFLENNGYEFNPMTYAIMSIIHELGHIEFHKIMLNSRIHDLYWHINLSNNDLLSVTLKNHEKDLADEGVHVRYLLSGDEMFCDGYAMTYFRAVCNTLIERGFDGSVFTEKFNLGECIKYDGTH